MYLGLSCHDRPFSEELGDIEINTRICRVHAYGVILSIGTGPNPLRERVDNPWVSPLRPTFSNLCQFLFLSVFMFLHRVLSVFTMPGEGSPSLRMWQCGKPILPIANDCSYGANGGGLECYSNVG
jgi:hypothetical protein